LSQAIGRSGDLYEDEDLFGPGLPEERVGVYARPTDHAVYCLQERERQHAIPFVCVLILEMNEIEHVDRDRQVGAVKAFHGVDVELVQHAHQAVVVRGGCPCHLACIFWGGGAFAACCPY
jgi:hypothetical protein